MFDHPHLANPVLTKEEALSFLKPHFEKIRKCIDDAWEEWLAIPNRHKLDKRARAAFLHSTITHYALAAFSKQTGTKPVPGNGTFWLYIGDHIKTRFKKLDSKRRYRNYPTQTQLKLEIQGNIPGVLPGTYLTLGYQLDELEQNIARHLVTLQIRKKVHYEIDIDEELGTTVIQVVPMPAPTPAAETKRRRVRPRQAPAKEKAKGTASGE